MTPFDLHKYLEAAKVDEQVCKPNAALILTLRRRAELLVELWEAAAACFELGSTQEQDRQRIAAVLAKLRDVKP